MEIPPGVDIPLCDVVGCKQEAVCFLPVNDADSTVTFFLCNEHWTMLDDGKDVELNDHESGQFYKLNFSPPEDMIETDT